MGRLELADRAFARTLELDPDRPGMRHQYGRLLREMDRLEASEEQLRIALAQTPGSHASTAAEPVRVVATSIGTEVSLAETLIALSRLDEAEVLIEEVLRREPNHAEALRAMGHLLLARGRSSEAVEYFRQAARGRDPERWIDLARAFLAAGDPKRAHDAAREALARSPAHPWALTLSGHALVLGGKKEEGLELLGRSLALRPRRPAVWRDLALAFEAAGDTATARTCRSEAEAFSGS
jgi:predicted Zn-dependent protease